MINLKTKLSFDILFERRPKNNVRRSTKSISKFFVVVKEVIKKSLLRS